MQRQHHLKHAQSARQAPQSLSQDEQQPQSDMTAIQWQQLQSSGEKTAPMLSYTKPALMPKLVEADFKLDTHCLSKSMMKHFCMTSEND